MASLVMNPGLADERTFPLSTGITTIGRTKDNQVFCLHKSLSRKHAQVEFDGIKLKVTDLQSKNGVYHQGRRVSHCELLEGETFRCGDITFLLEGGTVRSPRLLPPLERTAQTLPSPIVVSARQAAASSQRAPATESTDRVSRDRLFLLIRASELCVSRIGIEKVLEELVLLVVQVLDADRIALLTLDNETLQMRPRVLKTRVGQGHQPYSKRVIDWIVQTGSPATFSDVSRDRALPGDGTRDFDVKGAMAVPIDPGGGTIGVLYVDSTAAQDAFNADDLALLRAIANLAAVIIESEALHAAR